MRGPQRTASGAAVLAACVLAATVVAAPVMAAGSRGSRSFGSFVATSASDPTSAQGGAPAVTATSTATETVTTYPVLAFAPTADAQVAQSSPLTNYGTSPALRARGSETDQRNSYLKFEVSGLTGYVSSAKLRLYVSDTSPDGGSVYVAGNTWLESSIGGITWLTAPPILGEPLWSVKASTLGAWVEFDVGPGVSGNGTFSFALTSRSTDSVFYSSREGANPPQLVVTQSDAPQQPVDAAIGVNPPLSGTAPFTVQFRDVSTGSPTRWAWDFDNNGTVDSTSKNPRYVYRSPGIYSVKLTARNATSIDTAVRLGLVVVRPGPVADPFDPVLVGAGDIASCSSLGDQATATLLDTIPGTVFTAGDNAYESGTASEFANCYDPSWGRHKARTRPSVGNHEYKTSGATGYFDYFGAAAGSRSKGYYSYDLGKWHIVVLNSNCPAVGGCGAGSPQETWLRADLAASTSQCTLGYWHHPLFSSGEHGNVLDVKPLWQALQAEGAEVVVAGHDHLYERFAPQTADGVADPNGIREFVVGTGGRSLYLFSAARPNSVARSRGSYGVLKLTLHGDGYTWEFLPVAGLFVDAGSGFCH
ncbi:MAG: DNRLRE domain-containing protein [Chloroflexota bacterium]|nr:DNRLRE domain-containing protein [Chloroflexota bacterium]